MRDPQPHRISGGKEVRVEYQVNVSHLMIAIAALVAAYLAYRVVTPSGEAEATDEGEESEEFDVEIMPSGQGGLRNR